MNEYDSNRIYDLTAAIGFSKTNIKTEADCFLINTCHIRDKSTEKVYHEVGRVKKDFRNLKKPLVIVAGCVAQAESNEIIKREPYIDMVIGPQSYHKIKDLILEFEKKKKKINATDFNVVKKFDEIKKISNSQNQTSSYLTIQEGCDKFCHFCVVPYTRGPEYSRPFNQIIDEAKNLINNGSKEITLLGQNVNAYKSIEGKKNYKLSSLIIELNKIKELKRIRFTTSHPKDMTEDLINCYKDCEKLMPILHLPIQSGSDRILKLMNRKHTIKYYLSIIEKLKTVNNNIKISSDFMVGYPGETHKDFQDTVNLIKKVGFVNSYSYIFSPRPGTPAAEKKVNSLIENKSRLRNIQNILENIQHENNKSYLDKDCEVLIENKLKKQERYFGRNKYMSAVFFDADNCKIGDLVNIKIISFNKKNLSGIYKTSSTKAA
jgi:tRNA-2-methylthio-N6-dimethylallyladenosine synthase